ncbi:hypothetical protein GGF39_001854 [Coemansia sp. RSA 1721]|nr:hypothetical protein GGF39_001854 [Coemansia sp. RSA 1721]
MPHTISRRKQAQKVNGIADAKHSDEDADSRQSSAQVANASSADKADSHPGQPSVLTMTCITIALMTTSILAGFMVSLGPQYMEPLYGNVLPRVKFMRGLVASLVVGGLMAMGCWRHVLVSATGRNTSLRADTKTGRALATAIDIAALLMAAAPPLSAYVMSWSGYMGPIWGPTLTHCTLTFPVFVLLGFTLAISAARIFFSHASVLSQAAMLFTFVSAAALPAAFALQQPSFQRSCTGLLSMSAFAALGSLVIKLLTVYQEQTGSTSVARASKPRFLPTLLVILVALASLLGDNRCSVDGVIKANGNYTMLSREESVTGWVITSDEHERDIRLLRSGHSIIGGHWRSTKESIFGVFYYADAVRMIRGAPKTDERALQIGLGVGISARSLHNQGVKVDVVEIDPAVHRAAEQFFDLPRDLNTVYLQDARQYIETAPTALYNYIVHDVFTGGSVPASLFSKEAIAHVRRIMLPSGVLAMNYVGVPNDKRVMEHIVATLRTSFKHVRCFGEFEAKNYYTFKRDKERQMNSMVNMMFFASNERIEFRIPQPSQKSKSNASIRDAMLTSMLGNEVMLDHLSSDVRPLTDSWNPLTQWQVGTAIDHWHTMRKLFSEEYWLEY